MIYDLYEIIPNTGRVYMRDDQVKYSWEKPGKRGKKSRVRITFGREVVVRMKIAKDFFLKIEWDDKNRFMIITRSDKGFKVYKRNNQRLFVLFNEPVKAKLPHIKKIFTNYVIGGQHELILDFSMVQGDEI